MRFQFLAKLVILCNRNVTNIRFLSLTTFPFESFARVISSVEERCGYCGAFFPGEESFIAAEFIHHSGSWAFIYLCEACSEPAVVGWLNRN